MPKQVPPHHTRQEDAEYIGVEILKDTVGPPPAENASPRLERLENEWPTPLGKPVATPAEAAPSRSFFDTIKRLFSRKKP